MDTLGFLGPLGTHSEAAALHLNGFLDEPRELMGFPAIFQALLAVEEAQVKGALVPVENSLEGSVNITLDTLSASDAFAVTLELIWGVRNELMVKYPQSEIRSVISHAQPLSQCRAYLKAHCPHAKLVAVSSTAEAARLVAADEIDILCDLSGHTKDNCLAVLARKPAPVQVTGLGYMGRTGLSMIDYVLGDRVLDAAEEAEDAAAERCRGAVEDGASQGAREERSERPLSLPHSHFCYLPFVAMPDVAPPPCLSRGHITFGCFNNYSKVTDAMLILWRQLLTDVPGARLLLKSRLFGSEEGRSLAVERFERLGLDASRIELRGFSSDYLAEYADMDIALDTAPYTGGLTTCEALYMGVPVVTLKGGTHGARFGASLLQNAGLPELIAEDAAQYVEIAKLLAGSPETLQMLREKQRDMLLASPLMNFRQYVQEVEAAYEEVWRRWEDGE